MNVQDIHSKHWQPEIHGDIVANIDDINQAISIILSTPKGFEPLRPDFGSNVHLYLDYPIDRARAHVVRETILAIRRWEPRVEVERVTYFIVPPAQAQVHVYWRLKPEWAVGQNVQQETKVLLASSGVMS